MQSIYIAKEPNVLFMMSVSFHAFLFLFIWFGFVNTATASYDIFLMEMNIQNRDRIVYLNQQSYITYKFFFTDLDL